MAFRKILTPTVLIIGLCASVQPANAVTVSYCGPNVCYEYDNAQNAGLFGPVSFIGDSAYWTPTTFEARSTDGVGLHSGTNTDTVGQTWVFSKVYSIIPSNEIVSIWAHEDGDYEINYAAGEVHGDLYLRAKGLNNLAELTPPVIDAFDQVGGPFGLQQWAMDATVTPQASMTQLANNMTLTIQNTLSAFTSNSTGGSELAWIEKKLVLNITTVVPVPAAAWLMGSAVGLLGFARRRTGA